MKKLFTTVGLAALVATPVLAQIKESRPATGANASGLTSVREYTNGQVT